MARELDSYNYPLSGGSTYGALTGVTLSATTAKLIAAARPARNSLIIANTTGGTLYLSFSSSTGLDTDTFALALGANASLVLHDAEAKAAVYGYSVAGGVVTYQESPAA